MTSPSLRQARRSDDKPVASDEEFSGAICDVGYSTEHYFKTTSKCVVCNKTGRVVFESGWIGSRILHLNKSCRGYFEVDDGGICWKKQVTLEVYEAILKDANKALERDEKAKDATGRKCRDCSTTRGIGYYGMYPDPLKCFCQRCHLNYINSQEWRTEHGLDEATELSNLTDDHANTEASQQASSNHALGEAV